MNKKPLVTAVITTYNRPQLVKKAIRSVLNQTYVPFEIIVTEDGSDSGVADWIQKKGLTQITYIRHDQNCGLAAARNTGIENANGEYIAFLDDDDEWKPGCVEKRIDILSNLSKEEFNKLGVIYCGNEIHIPHENRIIPNMPKVKGNIRKFMQENTTVFPAPSSTLLFPRKVLEQIGGFDEHILSSVDHDIWTSLAANGLDARAVEEVLVIVYHIKHKKSMVSNAKLRIQGVEQFFKKWTPIYQEWYGERGAKRFINRYRTDVLGRLAGQKLAEGRLLDALYLTSHVVRQNAFFPLEIIRLVIYYIRYLVRLCIPKRLIAIIRGEQ